MDTQSIWQNFQRFCGVNSTPQLPVYPLLKLSNTFWWNLFTLAHAHIESRYKRIRKFGNEIQGPQFLTQREDRQLAFCPSLAILLAIRYFRHLIVIASPYKSCTGTPREVTLDQMRTSLASGNELHIPCGDQCHTLFMLSVAHHTFIQPNKPSQEGIPGSSWIITKTKKPDSGVLVGT
jgi:hypothetical protein